MIIEYLVDVLLAAVVVIAALSGKRRGLARLLIAVAAVAGGVLIAREAASTVGRWLYDNLLEQRLITAIARRLEETGGSSAAALIAALPDYAVSLASKAGISLEDTLGSINISGLDSMGIAAAVTDKVLRAPVISVVQIAAFAVLAFVVYSLLTLILSPISRIFRLPVLKQLNSLLGLILGTVKGVAVAAILCYALYAAASLCEQTKFAEYVDNSRIVSYVCERTDVSVENTLN